MPDDTLKCPPPSLPRINHMKLISEEKPQLCLAFKKHTIQIMSEGTLNGKSHDYTQKCTPL
jgi:hypothetical protein